MKKGKATGCRFGEAVFMALVFLVLGAGWVRADEPIMRITARPLTPQEVSDYGMTNTTQIASGNHVVGLGQPVYLEFLVQKGVVGGRHPIDFVTVTQVVWTLESAVDDLGDDLATTATIMDTVIPTNMPAYDGGHQQQFDIIDRAMIIPDLRGTYTIGLDAKTVEMGTVHLTYDVVGSVFIGKDSTACTLCHSSKQDGFNATGHATAFQRKISADGGYFKESCTSCHVLGYDTAPAADNGGFDDVAADLGWTFPSMPMSTNNWDDMPLALQMKANVQCESCHGPAQEHLRTGGDTGKIAVNLSAGNCSQCHDKKTHHTKTTEWKETPHAQGYVFRDGSCAPCHSTIGYINANDPGMNELGVEVEVTGTSMEGVTCAACHDPHAPASGVHQVRAIESVTLANGFEITDGGIGKACMACHHDRYEANSRAAAGNTPHHGTQTDLLFGQNAIEYGQDLPSSRHWDVVEDSCAQCHMQDNEDVPAYAQYKVGGHSFGLSYDDGTNAPVYLTETCTSCHGEIEDFNFGGADYDLDGMVEGVQSEISDMMDELEHLVSLAPSGQSKNKANYNLVMVEDDGSYGVHNPKYIAAILRSSIDDLKGGIDIDKDGLVDSWEVANFGNITSQSGADDYDGDGLTNEQEENIGTSALLVDTDGDGISDLAEIQGSSDPLDIDSVPTSDMVILPAAEIGYMPKGTNTTVQFQVIEDLGGGSWEDVGTVQTNNGAGWLYQLDSYRGNTNRFYRAIED